MVTDEAIKHEFIVQTLKWGLDKLRRAQIEQLNAKRNPIEQSGFNWESLFENVSGRMDGVIGSNGHYRIMLPVDIRLRFADMKRLAIRKAPMQPSITVPHGECFSDAMTVYAHAFRPA